jgi:hypothetical protein
VLRFVPHNDGDFFVKDPAHLLETAPKQPTLIGFNELEMGIYGKLF